MFINFRWFGVPCRLDYAKCIPRIQNGSRGSGFPGNFFHDVLYGVRYILDNFLDFADSLVGFAFLAKFIIANQNTGGLFDSTFYFICLTLIDSTPVPSKLVNQTIAHCIWLPTLNTHRPCQ